MRLKSSIFLWVSLATIIPLSALILGITAYSERLYRNNVDMDIHASMETIISELEFRLEYEKQVIISLATSPAMNHFFPILKSAMEGDLHHAYFEEVDKLNDFLAGFQHSVPGLDTVRVLDLDGNTLVKVRFGKYLPALFESMEDVPFAEEELVDTQFLDWMRQLQPYQLVYGQLPLSRRDFVSGQELSLLNAIVPLADSNKQTIGFLSARALGDQIDHIFKALPRSNNFRLTIAELNPNNKQRHGMILYSDDKQIIFNQPHDPDTKLDQKSDPQLWQQLEQQRFGTFHAIDSTRHYYQEFYPYSNQLVSWVIILHLDDEELAAPFQSIRIGLFVFAFVALAISLLLANMGARHIAEPIRQFASTLKSYADGETQLKSHLPSGAEELKQLDHSFHYLVDTLETTQNERDKAQKMMLQNAKLASIGEMAAGIGHEINNPLNNILSFSKLIERDLPNSSDHLKQDIEGLRNEALRAGRIVKGILNFARQVPPEYTEFDLRVWLVDTLLLVKPEAHKQRVSSQLKQVPDLCIEGDRNQLQQVLVNLLMNAIQASEVNQTIELSAELVNDLQVKICVSDQGKGLDKQSRDKAFDPFFTTKGIGEGSGLGLSISLGIVQYHDGKLDLVNNERGGVDAIITLPINQTH